MTTMGRRILAGAAGAVALGTLGCGVAALGLFGAWFKPAAVRSERVRCTADAPELPPGKRLRVLSWNIQYAGSRKHHFFYDGGDAVTVPEADVRETLDAIAEVVRRVDPDLILWQEVDVGSRRTHKIDEQAELLARLPSYPCTTDAPYHKAPYVPHPPQEHIGAVDMRLAVWSRYKIDAATRYDLPRLQESWVRQQFNLKRALLEVELPIAGGGKLIAFDSHLSAFSNGDGTIPKQLAVIAERLDAAESAGNPWLLGADLNTLPPGDDPARLGGRGGLYEAVSPLTGWYDRYQPAVPLAEHSGDPAPWRTYLPWGSDVPDRAIDHVFYGSKVEMHAFSVLQDVNRVSDHHPLIFDFEVKP